MLENDLVTYRIFTLNESARDLILFLELKLVVWQIQWHENFRSRKIIFSSNPSIFHFTLRGLLALYELLPHPLFRVLCLSSNSQACKCNSYQIWFTWYRSNKTEWGLFELIYLLYQEESSREVFSKNTECMGKCGDRQADGYLLMLTHVQVSKFDCMSIPSHGDL